MFHNLAAFVIIFASLTMAIHQPVSAEIPADSPLATLPPDQIVAQYIEPNLKTEGESATVTQMTKHGKATETKHFTREAVLTDNLARVEITYDSGARYVDQIDGTTRQQSYQSSPSEAVRWLRGSDDQPIAGSAFSFRDLHLLLLTYKWVERELQNGVLTIGGRGGPYSHIIVTTDLVSGKLVITSMTMFDEDGVQWKVATFGEFIILGDKVRPKKVVMRDTNHTGSQEDDIVTTLSLEWLTAQRPIAVPANF